MPSPGRALQKSSGGEGNLATASGPQLRSDLLDATVDKGVKLGDRYEWGTKRSIGAECSSLDESANGDRFDSQSSCCIRDLEGDWGWDCVLHGGWSRVPHGCSCGFHKTQIVSSDLSGRKGHNQL